MQARRHSHANTHTRATASVRRNQGTCISGTHLLLHAYCLYPSDTHILIHSIHKSLALLSQHCENREYEPMSTFCRLQTIWPFVYGQKNRCVSHCFASFFGEFIEKQNHSVMAMQLDQKMNSSICKRK